MASIFHSQDDNKQQLQKISQLQVERSEYFMNTSSNTETWKCSFSQDERIFGWSRGKRQVSLLPVSHVEFPNRRISRNDLFDLNQQKFDQLDIDCGYLVRSLIFASISDEDNNSKNKSATSRAFWRRIAQRKDLFLITGHVNDGQRHGRIRVWDVETGSLLLQLLDHEDVVTDLKFFGKDKNILASTSFDGSTKVWDLNDEGNLVKTLTTDGKAIHACCWSPDGKNLVTVGVNKIVNVWDVNNNFSLRLQLIGHQHTVIDCEFSPDSSLLATASWDTRVIIWNSVQGTLLRELFHLLPPPTMIFASGENGTWIRSLSFSSDGVHVSTVCDGGLVRVWDIESGFAEEVSPIEQGLCCSFSPSSRFLAVGTRSGNVFVYKPRRCVKSLRYLSRQVVRRNFSIFDDHKFYRNDDKAIIPYTVADYLLYHTI